MVPQPPITGSISGETVTISPADTRSMFGAITDGLTKMISNGMRQRSGYTMRHIGGWAPPKSKYAPHVGKKQAAKAAKRSGA